MLWAASQETQLAIFDEILKGGQVVGSVYFGLRDVSLSREAEAELDRIAAGFSGAEVPFIVRVEGYADSSLEKKTGIQLSMQRAQSVKLYLSGKFPELKVEFYMTGFGETRPVVPKEGESIEAIRERERRVDLVIYSGASFFAEEKKAISPPPAASTETKVAARKAERADAPRSALKKAPEIVVAARSFKRYILSPGFFREDYSLREEASPLLENILNEVRGDGRWIFVAAHDDESDAPSAGREASLRRQLSLAREIIDGQRIDPERLFVRGGRVKGMSYEDDTGESGEIYIYIPIQ